MRSHHLRAASGGSGATDLASFFGVDSSTSTTLRVQILDQRYAGQDTEPTNGWADYPLLTNANIGNTGTYISLVGITATDNIGMWNGGNRYGYSYGTNGYPTDTVICSTVSSISGFHGESLSNAQTYLTSNTPVSSTHGIYVYNAGLTNSASGNQQYVDCVFSNGLGTAIGVVISYYTGIANGTFYNHNPLIRITCNNISATFAPKGDYDQNSNTKDTNGQTTGAGAVLYPTLYDPTTISAVDALFGSLSGNTLPSNYFVY